MPWAPVTLIPGTNVEETPTYRQTGYVRTDNGRFKAGLFQKLGGWVKYVDIVFSGGIKHLWGWQDLNRVKRLSVATTTGVTVVSSTGLPAVITPQTLDTDDPPDISTTNGDATVTIVDGNTSGLTTDDVVYFRTPVSIGGIILSGIYQIATITGADSYTIEAQTPATATEANAGAVPEFVTAVGSAAVAVNLDDHAQVVGNDVVFPIATSVGGISILGKYTVTRVVSADQFEITASEAATSVDTQEMNGGDVGFTYYIALGPAASGVGYGVGDYGEGDYGKGTSSVGVQTGTTITATDWTQDNWGEILIATPEGGGIYYWQPNSGFSNLAIIPNGPLFNDGAFVSMAQQQIIAWGSSIDARLSGGIGIYQDPLLIQWSDIGNFFEWTPDPTNFARNYRVPTGSRCIAGAATKNRNLVWTDVDVHAGTFNSGQTVYSWNRVGSNCGIIGKHAWMQQADTVYWMGVGNFFAYAGAGVQPMPCSVWDAVFQNLHPDHQHKVNGASNSDFTEVGWLYPSLDGGGTLDRYVKYNVIEQVWDNGARDRCAWLDRSVLGYPLGASSAGIVYAHENGFDDDNMPLLPFMETGYFYLDEGEQFTFIDEVWPDFKWGLFGGSETAQILITLLCVNAPGETPVEYGPYVVSKSTPFIIPDAPDGTRVRARQIALRVASIDIGSFWRLGKVRFRYAPDGRMG